MTPAKVDATSVTANENACTRPMVRTLSASSPDFGDQVKLLVEMLVRALVDDKEAVQVTAVSSEHNTIIEVHVAQGDFGKLIGKQGRHAEAIRTIATGAVRNSKHQVRVSFIEP
jgi:predicted RNA-binding protein YlqC (UPF0109 family)